MQNYVRSGSYYKELLSSVEGIYPGLKVQWSKTELSVQDQGRYPHGTPIDMRG